jgi:orotate phosphoribosyltransferase
MPNARLELLTQLAEYAYQYDASRPFRLTSGKRSDEYLDCKMALCQPAAMLALGELVYDLLGSDVVAIGGPTMGADPIAMSACQRSASEPRPIRWFTVRKDPKEHGKRKQVEGRVLSGECVAVVDDVVTSGQSTIQAIKACLEHGLKIKQVIVLVDRQELEGLNNIRSAAGEEVEVSALFTKSEIKGRWKELHRRLSRDVASGEPDA